MNKKPAIILEKLKSEYPDFKIELGRNSFEILVSTILSAQANDKQTIPMAKKLLRRYKKPESLAIADICDIEHIIKSIGLYKTKAKRLVSVAKIIVERHKGRVPRTMKELLLLPGVGRKTANIVLTKAFGKIEGIAVDTHVFRVSKRLGLSLGKTPFAVEKDLMKIYPKNAWSTINELFIMHGRNRCKAKRPGCEHCCLKQYCNYYKEVFRGAS
ncbi:MAG: endonuclease III [Candidatus Diapherotrites archaeon]|nr:endonuclease III [Candidatus Diapherotrites archaeon]